MTFGGGQRLGAHTSASHTAPSHAPSTTGGARWLLQGSPQYNWFKEQLASIDRAKYPWLLVAHHVPIYNTLIS